MGIILTLHARKRMKERGISMVRVRQTVLHPDYARIIFGNKYSAKKSFNNEMLEVIYKRTLKSFIIITTYYED